MILATRKIPFGASYVCTTDGGSHIELQTFNYAPAVIIWNTLRPSETSTPYMVNRDVRCESLDVQFSGLEVQKMTLEGCIQDLPTKCLTIHAKGDQPVTLHGRFVNPALLVPMGKRKTRIRQSPSAGSRWSWHLSCVSDIRLLAPSLN